MKQPYLSLSSLFCGLALLSVFDACTPIESVRTEPFEHGVIVLEAGQSGRGTASVSFIALDKSVRTGLFTAVNERPLGDLAHSYTEIDGKGYIVVSNSDKVEIIENSTFRSIALINKGVEQCRYMVAGPLQSGFILKGYVSYWGGKTLSPGVAIVSLADRKVIDHISVGAGPEQMAVVGDQLFVALSGGKETVGNTVAVINMTTDQLVTTIPVGDVPTSISFDSVSGLLHVLCSGKPTRLNAGSTTTAEVVRINPVTRQVVSRIVIGNRPISANPTNLVFNPTSQTFYFLLKGAIYSFPATATAISVDKPLINQSFTGLGVDPATNIIYGGYSPDSTGKGVVRRFQPTGTRLDSVSVGPVPTDFYFK